MIAYYILSQKIGSEKEKEPLLVSSLDEAFIEGCNVWSGISKSERCNYYEFQIAKVDEDENGILAFIAQLPIVNKGETVYYFPAPNYMDEFFGSENPVCVDAVEMIRLFSEWIQYWNSGDMEIYFSGMTIASNSQIEKFGVYNS